MSSFLFNFQGTGGQGTYQIATSSALYIEGTSNVTDFRCDCTQSFTNSSFSCSKLPGNGDLTFHSTSLTIRSRKLDCGHSGINRDMQETLKSEEYPHITIELLHVSLPNDLMVNGYFSCPIQTKVAITIAGVRQIVHLNVYAEQKAASKYRFSSTHPLLLSSFGMKAPSPFLGLIKVSDEIKIFFDLEVSIF